MIDVIDAAIRDVARGKCDHPLHRVVWRGDANVWCWVCRTTDDEPRLLSQPDAWLVIERFRALDRPWPAPKRVSLADIPVHPA